MIRRGNGLTRAWLLLIFITICGMLGFGYYLQYGKGLAPCPLCILQRLAYIAIVFVALVGLLHNPRTGIIKIYSFLIALISIIGGSIAARQIWLQNQPKKLFSECSSSLNYMLESLPLKEVFLKLFYATGDCAEIVWTFLGFSIAQWSAVVFSFVLLSALVVFFKGYSDQVD